MPRTGRPRRDPIDRFVERVDFSTPEACWSWTGSLDRDGYGRFKIGHADQAGAHRRAWELFVGPIPEGLTIDHLCKNRACVNPDHLEPVTWAENGRRGPNVEKTHCVAGHPFDDENTYVYLRHSGPRRICRACARRRAKG